MSDDAVNPSRPATAGPAPGGTSPFSRPGVATGYAESTARRVPGLRDLHRMTTLLLAERVPVDGRVLVLGAGGGLELGAFAEAQPGWRLDGVDPSPEMLDQARATLGPLAARVAFHQGYIDDAPAGPFDGATCLLTLHFLPEAPRLATLRALHARLRPGAPLVVAHHSFPNGAADLDRWLARNAAFTIAAGVPAAQAIAGIPEMRARLPVLSPDEDVALMRQAGFSAIELFYAAFTFKGWVGYRS